MAARELLKAFAKSEASLKGLKSIKRRWPITGFFLQQIVLDGVTELPKAVVVFNVAQHKSNDSKVVTKAHVVRPVAGFWPMLCQELVEMWFRDVISQCQQVNYDACHGKDVGFPPIMASTLLFRRFIQFCAANSGGFVRSCLADLRKTEITNVYEVSFYQDILWFEIAMDNVLIMEVGEGGEQVKDPVE